MLIVEKQKSERAKNQKDCESSYKFVINIKDSLTFHNCCNWQVTMSM